MTFEFNKYIYIQEMDDYISPNKVLLMETMKYRYALLNIEDRIRIKYIAQLVVFVFCPSKLG